MKVKLLLLISFLIFFSIATNLVNAQPLVTFSHERGFYETSFDLTVTTSGYNLSVRYTLDGSEPTEFYGISPINVNTFTIPDVNRSTVFRAFIYNLEDTIAIAHTYVFVDDVFTQNNNSVINELIYPNDWGYGTGFIGAINCRRQAADYEMTIDDCITSIPNYQQKLKDGLMEIPTMAISLDKQQIFGVDSGIYVFPVEKSDVCYTLPDNVDNWERKASVEIFNDIQGTDTLDFQINAGLEMSGASTRYFDFYKHSFKLKFRSKYGSSKMKYPLYGEAATNRFESIQLRMVGQSTPHDFVALRREEPQFHKDSWMKYLQRELSGYGSSPSSKFFHLFINGLYWGIYDVTERPNKDYMADYFGGQPEDYDVIKVKEVKSGTDSVYNYMFDLGHSIYDTILTNPVYNPNTGVTVYNEKLETNENRAVNFYSEIKNLLDIENFIDYNLINLYFANIDWEENNWWAVRNAKQNGKFQFFVWDAEIILNLAGSRPTLFTAGNSGQYLKYHPIDLNQRLLDVPEYKIKFGDHIQCHCVEEDGILQQQNITDSYTAFENKIHNASLLEFARWGDARKLESDYEPICHDAVNATLLKYQTDVFPNLLNYMLTIYGTERNEYKIFPNYLKQNTLTSYTDIFNFKAVKLSKLGGEVPMNYPLTLTNPNTHYNTNNQIVPTGEIYFTTDGTDPRNVDGTISSTAIKYTNPILIDEYKMIKARIFAETFNYRNSGTKTKNNLWTAMCPREFFPEGYYDDLVINEIHYNPADLGAVSGSNLEFLEIKNIGSSELNISNTKFTEGVKFQFPMGYKVQGNGFILLASDSVAAKNHYSTIVDGQYTGKLANSGDLLILSKPDGSQIDEVKYDDAPPWNVKPDGGGSSLSLYLNNNDKKNNHLATSWSNSAGNNTPRTDNVFCLPITLSTTAYEPSCYNGNDGMASVSITGGSQPYNIIWSTNSNLSYISNLVSGTYEVEVTDDQNCTETKSVAIVSPNQIFSNLQVTHATSVNTADGFATISPSNVPQGYSVVWSDGSTGSTNNNLSIGNNYWVTITDNRSDTCSITETFSVELANSCTIPINFSAIPTSEQSAIISWPGNADNTSYIVSYKELAATNWNTITTTLPSLLLNNLNTCTTYQYKVSAMCNTITSNSSTIQSFSTAGCIDFCNGGAVNGNTINITSYSSFILWDIIPNAMYRLNYRKNGINSWHQYETPLNFAILFGLDNCSNYEWYIDVICPDGTINANSVNNFTTADCFRITEDIKSNIEELKTDLEFILYPNPAQNFIKISSKDVESIIESKILIYDFSGRLVKNGGTITTQAIIYIEDLLPGMYVVQIVNEKQNLQYRFKKND